MRQNTSAAFSHAALLLGFAKVSQVQLQKTEQRPSLPYHVVGTGQTKCYDDPGEIAPPKPGQPFYGQEAQRRGPQPSYKLSADGLTVQDNNTG